MLVFTHPACLEHDPGIDHPESPERLHAVISALRAAFPDQLEWRNAPPAKLGELARVHSRELIDSVLQVQTAPLRRIDLDTFSSPGSASAALHAAGAGVAAVDAVMLEDGNTHVFCAVRPPGHHATADTAMGFCLFNNIAVAAAYARDKYGLERIAIVDFDVHHGNGTQAIFEADPKVAYYSTHQSGLFPFSGNMRERGVGNICNILLPPGSGGFRFRNTWADDLLPQVDAFRPQLLLVSAGFDAHHRDPLAQINLVGEDFDWATGRLLEMADKYTSNRVVSLLEGGYDLEGLAESAAMHILRMMKG